MSQPSYQEIPEELRRKLQEELSRVQTIYHFIEFIIRLKDPLFDTFDRPVHLLFGPNFTREDKGPNWAEINPFKEKYQIARGVKLPLTYDMQLTQAMRAVVLQSSDYRALTESLPLLVKAKENGFGNSPYAVILFIFDVLSNQFTDRKG